MMSSIKRSELIFLCGLLAIVSCHLANEAHAVGVLYADPGWMHAFDGNSAYYHDPDGPHPDYVNGGDTNNPGGGGDFPALIDIGPCGSNQQCKDMAIWQNESNSQWEGSVPGDPLGGTPNPFGTLFPPVPPPAPGGVGAFTDGPTTFIRIQDPGLPNPYGWADKDAQFDIGTARQEGNNRKIGFIHEMSRDAGFSGTDTILDDGVTISFRARIATAATGPLDMLWPEDGPAATAWPTDGLGYPVSNNSRGMIIISQGIEGSTITPPGRLAFSLLDDNTVAATQGGSQPIVLTKRGLVMNSRFNSANPLGTPDTNEATLATGNVAEIPNADLDEWHEFWITVQALPAPVDGNTHEVNVYKDGSLDPETFQTFLANEIDNDGSYLGMGLSSGSRAGGVDLDFIAYKEGIHPPEPPGGVDGDFNDDGKVDAADYVVWRKNNGGGTALPNDGGLGTPIGTAHYNLWRGNFGAMAPGSGSVVGAVPEPSAAILLSVATIVIGVFGRRGMRRVCP